MPSAVGRSFAAELEALTLRLEIRTAVGSSDWRCKVSSKLSLLANLVVKVDGLILGGGMANTFLLARGEQIGSSLAEPEMIKTAQEIMELALEKGCKLILPLDVNVAAELKRGAAYRVIYTRDILSSEMILDVGPETVKSAINFVSKCSTIIWNGPIGAFEIEPFDTATNAVANAVAAATKVKKVLSVAGGGDTAAALVNAGVNDQFSYISTAGGAFLEWLEGKTLPGVEALKIKSAINNC